MGIIMKLHYVGKYNLDLESLPHGEHMPGAVRFREAEDTKKLSLIANLLSIAITLVLMIFAILRCHEYIGRESLPLILLGCVCPMLALFPHEFLHAVCFRGDVYLYTNFSQGMVFVIGTETMTKARFIIMSLLPNLVFGILPFAVGMIFPRLFALALFGAVCTGMGAGDYYNVYNAATQMPKGARTYLYGFNSYWYMPSKD